MILSFAGKTPRIGRDVFVAPTAVIIGDVLLEEGASVWWGAVLRGDFGRIQVGEGSCVQDNAVVHADEAWPTLIGRNVTVGHGVSMEGCVIEDGAVIGMNSVVLHRARVGAGSVVAAGCVVREGQEIPAGVLAAGVPAVIKKELSGRSEEWIGLAAREYRALQSRYRAQGIGAAERTPAPEGE